MTLPVRTPNLTAPPEQYSREYMTNLLQSLLVHFREQNATGPLRATTLFADQLPASGFGLVAGMIFQDQGTLKVVRATDHYFASVSAMAGGIGTVTTIP